MAKEQLGEWLRAHVPKAEVHVDHHAVDNGQIPDVLARFPDGRQFAFEVQYSAISVDAWFKRHEGYAEQGITDVWFFGHIPPHGPPANPNDSAETLRHKRNALLRDIYSSDDNLRWIDPETGLIHSFLRCWPSGTGRALTEVSADPLSACRIEAERFVAPADDRLREADEARCAELARKREREEQRWLKASERADWRASTSARHSGWQDCRKGLIGQFGSVPEIIEDPGDEDRCIVAQHPSVWRAELFRRYVQGKVGGQFSAEHVLLDIAATAVNPRLAVREYLLRLWRTGFVSLEMTADGEIGGPVRIIQDLPNQQVNRVSEGELLLSGAEADIGSGARRHRLEVVHQRLEGGGGVRSELTQDERSVFVFEVRLDGPPTDRELESRACIVRSAGAQPVWFVLHMKGQEISLEYPCIPVVKVTGALFVVPSENAKVSLDEAVDQIVAKPDSAIRLLSKRSEFA